MCERFRRSHTYLYYTINRLELQPIFFIFYNFIKKTHIFSALLCFFSIEATINTFFRAVPKDF